MRKIRIDFNTKNLEDKIKNTKIFLQEIKEEGADFEFDLSRLNFIDAAKAALLLSAEAMNLNTKTRINCFVKDEKSRKIILNQKLKNAFFSVNLGNVKDYREIKRLKVGS